MRTATDETPASAPVRRTARRLGARLNGITGRVALAALAVGLALYALALITGTVGNLGRCGVFAIVGWFVLTAAIENEPQRSSGVDGSIRKFAESAGCCWRWRASSARRRPCRQACSSIGYPVPG